MKLLKDRIGVSTLCMPRIPIKAAPTAQSPGLLNPHSTLLSLFSDIILSSYTIVGYKFFLILSISTDLLV